MPVPNRRTRLDGKLKQANGLYVHSSPPRVLQINSAHIKQLIRMGDVERLEAMVYDGQGKKLVGEYSPDFKVRTFLKGVPALMSKISLLHDAVNSGRLEELQSLLEEDNEKTRKKMILAKDESGVGLLHKAVYYDLRDIVEWIVKSYPQAVNSKDADGRTPYHYTPMSQKSEGLQKLLKAAGAEPGALDNRQHSARYYKDHISELELPSAHKSRVNSTKEAGNKESGNNIKKSNIRIWIHQRDLNSLQQVVWEGHGGKLLVEHSNTPKVKRFLEAVPHILGAIKEVHTDVINDAFESLKLHTAPPAPNNLMNAKDVNGLTPLHKAAGLGREEMAEYIIAQNPKSLTTIDNEGRTPLHYSALVKDGSKMFDYLVEAGADEGALDNRSKSAAFYKTRSQELDAKLLHVIPECPRKAKESTQMDWSVLGMAASTPTEEAPKSVEEHEDAAEPATEDAPENGINGEHEEEVDHEEPIANGHSSAEPEENGEEEEAGGKGDAEEATEEKEEAHVDNGVGEGEKEEGDVAVEDVADNAEESKGVEENGDEADNNVDGEVQARTPSPPSERSRTPTPANAEKEEKQTQEQEELGGEEAQQEHEEEDKEDAEDIDSAEKVEEAAAADEMPEEPRAESAKPNNTVRGEEDKSGDEEDHIVEGEGVIEGVVNGENEVESVNEQGRGADSVADEADVATLIQEGNMEQLAALVLNGDGDKLMGYTSEVPELQSFLDNVPIYMEKINRIHKAARDGTLKDLQAALDRRKFAIAKDRVSPGGATPLHVAIVFGNTSVVRYLAGRFPETVTATDDDGRTPLHYAAVVPDNGHYYNLLVHLGANTRTEDKHGSTPEFYRSNQGDFSYRTLLQDFGAEELADEILSDKDMANTQVELPFFCTEEGRYLASSLGDPLIKGLTEVANKRPADPIAYLAQYLYNFANNNNNRSKSRARTQESQHISAANSPEPPNGNTLVPNSIDVVTVEPEELTPEEESAFSPTSRDEHGQSMLHFAAARSHGRNALFQLLQETDINVGYRDELYRTARDISIQANIPENTIEIDRYIMQIASKGDTDKLVELLLDGYDHIIDIIDEEGVPIIEAVGNANQPDTVAFLHSILAFEERRERVHHAIREGNLGDVREMLADENDTGSGKLLAIGRNSYGRCSLHIAVLCQQEEIVDLLANTFRDTLRIGDNLERTALHYAMGVEKIESISRVLVKAGAKRVQKDLKGRQPTYYFMNKSDILRLQEEEETF